ncbi:MAG: endonuclease/exonuclease/phosphatase family protein [Dehalococcoidia bacterium]|nr:endonuclease/exonuclease/phosphatase family protein [Dehalococcoidia bacterium]
MPAPDYGFRVASFNIRNDVDRYPERKPLLVSAFAGLSADLVGLQEVRLEGDRQDDLLAAAAPEHRLLSFDARYERHPDYGIAVLAGIGQVLAHETLPLSHGRPAQRVLVALPGQRTLWFVNVHLYHVVDRPAVRAEQAAALREWMAAAPRASAIVIAGDFNAPPHEPAYADMRTAGYRSASFEANGEEPALTWPSGIKAPTMDTDGDPACLDYIWVHGDIRVEGASIGANKPAPGDPTLYPSDHFALVADLVL